MLPQEERISIGEAKLHRTPREQMPPSDSPITGVAPDPKHGREGTLQAWFAEGSPVHVALVSPSSRGRACISLCLY